MSSEQLYITVIHENEKGVEVPVEAKPDCEGVYILTFDFLKMFFPSATALYTEKDDKTIAMLIKNGFIEIHDLTLIYKTRYHKVESQSSSPTSNPTNLKLKIADMVKRQRILDIKRRIEGEPVDEDVKTSEPRNKKRKLSDIREAVGIKCLPKMKSVQVGLKMKMDVDDSFRQLKSNQGGGLVTLNLEFDKVYSVNDIINMAIPKFTASRAKRYLKFSTHKLGLSNDLEIEKFCDDAGKHIGILEYFTLHDLWKARKNLYLLCTATEAFWGEAANKDGNSTDSSKENDHDSPFTDKEESFLEDNENCDKFNDSSLRENSAKSEKMPTKKKSCVKEPSKNDQRSFEKDHSNSAPIPQRDKSASKEVTEIQSEINKTKIMPQQCQEPFEDLTDKIINQTEKELLMSADDDEVFVNICNEIDVRYWITRRSRYPPHSFIQSEQPKQNVFDDFIKNLDGQPEPDYDLFDPVKNGYPISKIQVNEHCLLQIWIDENEKLTMDFPNLKNEKDVQPHTLLYDVYQVIGSYDKNWCIAAIPFCFATCKPVFTWYKDDQIYDEGENLYALTNIMLSEVQSTWNCQIKCLNGSTCCSKKIKLKTEVKSKNLAGVKMLTKNDFSIDKSVPIGMGTQATVYKGKFEELPVAVKAIKVYTTISKDTLNEINVLKSLIHPNFVRLIGVCVEKKQIYLVLEYFEGKTLMDVIHDEDNHEIFGFRENKSKLVLQLATAIQFLQDRINPIIHRDLKPDNILIDTSCNLKVCDFGLSKFTLLQTNLRSTCGARQVGTSLYSAPEILLDDEPHSVWSDLWSVACIIVEIYKEAPAWEVNDVLELKQKMKDGQVPDYYLVQNLEFQNLRGIVGDCFYYSKERRLPADKLLCQLKQAFADVD